MTSYKPGVRRRKPPRGFSRIIHGPP
jgi:hypothetical protein